MLLNCNMPKMNPCKYSINSPLRVFLVLLGFTLFSGPSAFSQVEVLNGGFEFSKGYPSTSGLWQMMYDWTNAGSSTANPDFYHIDGNNGGAVSANTRTPLPSSASIDGTNGRASSADTMSSPLPSMPP